MSWLVFCGCAGLVIGWIVGLMFRIQGSRVELERRPLPRVIVLVIALLLLGGILNVGAAGYRSQRCIDKLRGALAQEQLDIGVTEPEVDEAVEEQRRTAVFRHYHEEYAEKLGQGCSAL